MNFHHLRANRWWAGLSALLLGLGLAACTQVAQARCGDGLCLPGETVASCRTDCALPQASESVLVNNGPAIRGAADGNGLVVGSVYPDRGQAVLELSRYNAHLKNASRYTVLRRPLSGKGGLGNPHPLRAPDGSIYLAFRDHQLADDQNPVYTLRVVRSTDNGKSWSYLDDGQGIIDTSRAGLWEPFLYFDREQRLRVVYAKERAEKLCSRQGGKKQDIVTRVSNDQGKTWHDEQVVSGDGVSRDGVPAVTRLKDGSYLMVFESWRDGTCGKANPNLLIRSMQSADGVHWTQRQVVFDPSRSSRQSIATWPSVVTLPDGRALVSFTSDSLSLGVAPSPKELRSKLVESFDGYFLISKPGFKMGVIEWDISSLTPVLLHRSKDGYANRFTSLAILKGGRVVLFSGLPNRFVVYAY